MARSPGACSELASTTSSTAGSSSSAGATPAGTSDSASGSPRSSIASAGGASTSEEKSSGSRASSSASVSGGAAGQPSSTFSLASSSSSAASGVQVRSSPCPSGSSIRFNGQPFLFVVAVQLALMMDRRADRVPELLPLRLEVVAVVVVGLDLDRLLRHGREPEPADPRDLPRVVREHADGREPEVGEDLRADPVLARIRLEAELEVRLDRVEALLLELVRPELVEQADAAPLLGEIEHDAEPFGLDPFQCTRELLAAVAPARVEDVARKAFGVHPHEHVLLALDVALDERDVLLPRQHLRVGD